jgi:hypothetical protein
MKIPVGTDGEGETSPFGECDAVIGGLKKSTALMHYLVTSLSVIRSLENFLKLLSLHRDIPQRSHRTRLRPDHASHKALVRAFSARFPQVTSFISQYAQSHQSP